MSPAVSIIPPQECDRMLRAVASMPLRVALFADICRFNALATIKRAGSGHVGSSFSSLDIVAWLYLAELTVETLGTRHPDRDIYFSSKGHDAPGLYAALYALGILPERQFIALRRLDGAGGHPDIRLPGIEANTGSLGMGISKAKGLAWAKRLQGREGRVIVMTGDGELQEGQIYEALQTAVAQRLANLEVIVDHNKVQSDRLVADTCDLGDLEAKIRAFGWHVARCDGHDPAALGRAFQAFRGITDRPKCLIADTVKGRGVSFMEHPAAFQQEPLYRWHSGAPDDAAFLAASEELLTRINQRVQRVGGSPAVLRRLEPPAPPVVAVAPAAPVSDGFEAALLDAAARYPHLVVLDADLSLDCRLETFRARHPERFIENGIAEQDMVSMAGGLALQGLLPVVNSFAAFLAARANEQIYANATERTKILYIGHYAGVLPAGAGHSHQSVRDIGLLSTVPGMLIVQPGDAPQARQLMAYCFDEAPGPCMIRLQMGCVADAIRLPSEILAMGQGMCLSGGEDAAIFAYGPALLCEAMRAEEQLRRLSIGVRVINLPWLNRIDTAWLLNALGDRQVIYVLEDHAVDGGLNGVLLRALAAAGALQQRQVHVIGVRGIPAWGQPEEVLAYHELDAASISRRVQRDLSRPLSAGRHIVMQGA